MLRIALLALFALAVPAFAQKDRVHFKDRAAGKDDSVDGDVTETAAGVKVTTAPGKDRVIPAADILRVEYAALDPTPGKLLIGQTETKGQTAPADALKYYADAAKAGGGNEKVKRFLLFREAYWQGQVAAAADTPAAFEAEAKKAVDKMTAFVKANPKTWEQWTLGRTAARLHGELREWKLADAVLKGLSEVADAPAEAKVDVKLSRVGYLLRGGDYAEAKSVLLEVEGDKATAGGLKDRAGIYKEALAALPAKDSAEADPSDPEGKAKKKVNPADAVAKVQKVIDASKDAAARGVGYGVLGELYLAHRLPRQAEWSYLWVDTVYPNDQDEHVLALARLVDLFAVTGDKDGEKSHSDRFRERLRTVR